MRDLLKQYRATYRLLEASRSELSAKDESERTPDDDYDLAHMESMMRDVGFIIRYIEQKKYPDPLHSVSRWATEKREILMDPDMMSRMFGYTHDFSHISADVGGYEHNETIMKFLNVLSPREREVFLLIRDQRYSYREAADLLGIYHGRVNNIMMRVNKKFEKLLNNEKPQSD